MFTLHVTKWALELDGGSYALLSAIATLSSLDDAIDLAENWVGGHAGRAGASGPHACGLIFDEKGDIHFRWIRPGQPERFDPPKKDQKFVYRGTEPGEGGSLLTLHIPLGTLPPAPSSPTANDFPDILRNGLMGEPDSVAKKK